MASVGSADILQLVEDDSTRWEEISSRFDQFDASLGTLRNAASMLSSAEGSSEVLANLSGHEC